MRTDSSGRRFAKRVDRAVPAVFTTLAVIILLIPFTSTLGLITSASLPDPPPATTRHLSSNISSTSSNRKISSQTTSSSSASSSQTCTVTSQKLSQACITIIKNLRVALVNSVFTSTAYGFGTQNGASFYTFYGKYAKTAPSVAIKKDLDLLSIRVSYQWGYSYGAYSFVQTQQMKGVLPAKLPIITDIDVNNGALSFANGTRKYDVVLVGFTEYLTAQEFANYKTFVQNGGKLIILDACNFLAEVTYNAATSKVALVQGHGWQFNGTAAQKGLYNFWDVSATGWVGSIYGYFYVIGYKIAGAVANTTNPASLALQSLYGKNLIMLPYTGHEENYLTNSTDSVIAYWNVKHLSENGVVAFYSHNYGKGVVIHTGIFATDVLASDSQMQFTILVCMLTTFK